MADTMVGYSSPARHWWSGQGHRGHRRRRVRRPRIHRRLRCGERQAAVALLRGARTRRVGNDTWHGDSWKQGGSPMWLTGSYDPSSICCIGRQSRAADRSLGQGRPRQPVQLSVVALDAKTGRGSGTTSSRRTTDTTGTRVRTWSSSIACGEASRASCSCTPIATASSTCWIASPASSSHATPFVYRTGTRASTRRDGPSSCRDRTRARPAGSSCIPRSSAAPTIRRRLTARSRLVLSPVRGNGQRYVSAPQPFEPGQQYIGRQRRRGAHSGAKPGEPPAVAGIKALDPDTGKTKWDFKIFQRLAGERRPRDGWQSSSSARSRDGNARGARCPQRQALSGTSRPAGRMAARQ